METRDRGKREMRIGILAYGSLTNDRGAEITEPPVEKQSGIRTRLNEKYERKILEKTNTTGLEEAWQKVRNQPGCKKTGC